MEHLKKLPKHNCPICNKRTPKMHVISHAQRHAERILFPDRKLVKLVNWIKRFYPINLERLAKIQLGKI